MDLLVLCTLSLYSCNYTVIHVLILCAIWKVISCVHLMDPPLFPCNPLQTLPLIMVLLYLPNVRGLSASRFWLTLTPAFPLYQSGGICSVKRWESSLAPNRAVPRHRGSLHTPRGGLLSASCVSIIMGRCSALVSLFTAITCTVRASGRRCRRPRALSGPSVCLSGTPTPTPPVWKHTPVILQRLSTAAYSGAVDRQVVLL